MENTKTEKQTVKEKLHMERCQRGVKKMVEYKSKNTIIISFSAIIMFALYIEVFGEMTGIKLERHNLNIVIALVLVPVGLYLVYLKTIYKTALYSAALVYDPDEK